MIGMQGKTMPPPVGTAADSGLQSEMRRVQEKRGKAAPEAGGGYSRVDVVPYTIRPGQILGGAGGRRQEMGWAYRRVRGVARRETLE